MGANSHNWHEFSTPTVNGYNSCTHSAIGHTPAVCHFTPRSSDNPTWAKTVAHVQKVRERMIERGNIDQISLGDDVFVVPRIRNIMKHLADRHFRDKKWGQAKVIEILDKNKFPVPYNGKSIPVNGWELTKTTL
jgi:hypothetical protein